MLPGYNARVNLGLGFCIIAAIGSYVWAKNWPTEHPARFDIATYSFEIDPGPFILALTARGFAFWACANLAVGKGYGWLWGVVGVPLSAFGVVLLYFFRDRHTVDRRPAYPISPTNFNDSPPH
jgi:hypothetical protein